jgi:hypothetical protein
MKLSKNKVVSKSSISLKKILLIPVLFWGLNDPQKEDCYLCIALN